MKKNIAIAIITIMTSVIILSGCSSKTDESSVNSSAVSKNSVDLEGTNIVDEVVEYKVKQINTIEKLEPPITESFYTFIKVKQEGNVFIDITIDMKYLGSESKYVDELIKPKIIIEDQEYTGRTVVEDDGGSDLTSGDIFKIDSLSQQRVHIITEVPEASLDKEVHAILTIDGKDFESKFNLQEVVPEKKVINVGDLLTAEDYMEVTIKSLEYTKNLEPSKPGNFYTHYEVDGQDKIYLVLGVNVKNLYEESLDVDKLLGVKVRYNEKYNYDSFAVAEEDDGSNLTYANISSIDPLGNGIVYYLCEMPEEVQSGKVEVEIYLDGELYYLVKE